MKSLCLNPKSLSKIKIEKIIQDITDMQSESIDNLNIDQIVAQSKNKLNKILESTDETHFQKNEKTGLYEYKAKVNHLNLDTLQSEYTE